MPDCCAVDSSPRENVGKTCSTADVGLMQGGWTFAMAATACSLNAVIDDL